MAVNTTVVPHGPLRWLTVWPSGQTQPSVSTLNSFDARIKANFGIFPLGSDGGLSFYATDDTDLILDVSGYFLAGSPTGALVFYPVTPCRLVDTRSTTLALGMAHRTNATPGLDTQRHDRGRHSECRDYLGWGERRHLRLCERRHGSRDRY